jgi:hypothetical protein
MKDVMRKGFLMLMLCLAALANIRLEGKKPQVVEGRTLGYPEDMLKVFGNVWQADGSIRQVGKTWTSKQKITLNNNKHEEKNIRKSTKLYKETHAAPCIDGNAAGTERGVGRRLRPDCCWSSVYGNRLTKYCDCFR